jgi:hypothetical protein
MKTSVYGANGSKWQDSSYMSTDYLIISVPFLLTKIWSTEIFFHEALRYKRKVAGLIVDDVNDFFFNLPNPSGSKGNDYQEMFRRGKLLLVHVARNLTAILCGVGSWTSHNPSDHHGALQGYLHLFICRWRSYVTGKTPIGIHALLRISLYFFYT